MFVAPSGLPGIVLGLACLPVRFCSAVMSQNQATSNNQRLVYVEKMKTYFEKEIDRIYGDDSLRPKQYIQIRQSKAFMEKYYADKLELNDLAKAAFMSRFHYIRVFQRIYGLTPRAYLRDLRISKAITLIKNGLSITQVCFEIGYESVPTFSSVFKNCKGCTPKEYQCLHNRNLE